MVGSSRTRLNEFMFRGENLNKFKSDVLEMYLNSLAPAVSTHIIRWDKDPVVEQTLQSNGALSLSNLEHFLLLPGPVSQTDRATEAGLADRYLPLRTWGTGYRATLDNTPVCARASLAAHRVVPAVSVVDYLSLVDTLTFRGLDTFAVLKHRACLITIDNF